MLGNSIADGRFRCPGPFWEVSLGTLGRLGAGTSSEDMMGYDVIGDVRSIHLLDNPATPPSPEDPLSHELLEMMMTFDGGRY
jgi:hypothetical protein